MSALNIAKATKQTKASVDVVEQTAAVVSTSKRVMGQKPLGTLIDSLWQLRENKRLLDKQVKDIEVSITASETELMERFKTDGIDKSTGKKATVSITEALIANIEDWDTFIAFVKKKNYFHLLQRRASIDGVRELIEKNGGVPGLKTFMKPKLNIRTLT